METELIKCLYCKRPLEESENEFHQSCKSEFEQFNPNKIWGLIILANKLIDLDIRKKFFKIPKIKWGFINNNVNYISSEFLNIFIDFNKVCDDRGFNTTNHKQNAFKLLEAHYRGIY